MFDQLRQDRAAALKAAQDAWAGTQSSLQPLRDQVAAHQSQLAVAQNALASANINAQQANANRDSAQRVVDQRQGERDAAAGGLAEAQRNLATVRGQEPDNPLPNGKPNPAIVPWRARLAQATTRVNNAQAALNQTLGPLSQAVQQRDSAAAAANTAAALVQGAQATVAAQTQSLAAVQAALVAAQGSLVGIQTALDQAQAAVTAVDTREARLLAEPLDRTDLETAVETEIAELTEQRRQRHDRLLRRAALMGQKTTLLVSQDADVAALAPIRDALANWGDAGRFASLASARAALDGVIAAAHAQQGRPPAERTDDLNAAQNAVAQAATDVRTALDQAVADRVQRAAALTTAAQALAKHQQEHP